LYLSTNDQPANAVLIAQVPDWTNSREWTKFSSQQSSAISLVGGQRYYIEVLHKESAGGDNVAVAWQGPGISQQVIPGSFLSPWVGPHGGGGTNNPPAVSITSPANGATFTAGANITISASASDSDGTVSKVDFYRGTTLLGTDTTSPYSYTWNNVPEGSYSLTAKATDDDLAVTTSAPIAITVNPAGSQADIYVNNIAMSFRKSGVNYFGRATVSIKDDTGANVSGATVYGTWSGSVSGSASGVTATDGTVLIESAAKKNGGTFTFTVTNVVKSGCVYNAALNVETSDSITAP
jgi:hypothetical protein